MNIKELKNADIFTEQGLNLFYNFMVAKTATGYSARHQLITSCAAHWNSLLREVQDELLRVGISKGKYKSEVIDELSESCFVNDNRQANSLFTLFYQERLRLVSGSRDLQIVNNRKLACPIISKNMMGNSERNLTDQETLQLAIMLGRASSAITGLCDKLEQAVTEYNKLVMDGSSYMSAEPALQERKLVDSITNFGDSIDNA